MQDRHVRFLLVGVKDTTIEHPNNVMLFSRTADQDELAEFYSVADAFVVCSVRENYPTTCLEAQCCGTPVFGFDTGGTSETSVFPESKFVEYGDVLSLRNALLNAFDFMTADVRRNISELARKKYSKDAQYCRYYSLYKSK
jgi:glycosyltransferase involved in cell wall biosynthesis